MTDEEKKKMIAVVVNGVRYAVPERFTLQDSRDVEKALSGFGGKGVDSVIASIFLAMRDVDQSVTGEQVLALDWNDIDLEYEDAEKAGDADVPPTQAAAQDEPQGAAI